MQIISIKNKLIDVSVLLNEESEDFFTNFVKSIKDSNDLSFDQKTNILKLTKRKSLKTSLARFIDIYHDCLDGDISRLDDNIYLNFSVETHSFMSSFLSKLISEQSLFTFLVFTLDTKSLYEEFKLPLGKSKTVISIDNIKDITLPTKSQWECIKKHIKSL
jgi:uncharacterized protein YdgA (DUF945 family)